MTDEERELREFQRCMENAQEPPWLRELPWLGDIDRRDDDDVEFCVEDPE